MKAKYVRVVSVVACVAIMFTAIVLTRTEIHGAATNTVLFYNDRTWTISSRLPAEQVHTVYYVPISFLVQLPSVEVRMNEALGTFIITHGDFFLSFDTTTDFAANQDKERTYLKTAEYHNERYVPVRTVCAYLDLKYEEITNSVTGVTAIRVSDGSEQTPFKDLIKQKYPTLFPDEPAKDSQTQDTSGQGQTDTDRTPIVSKRTVYLTVEGCTGRYTDAILSTLNRYGYKTTFFVSEAEIGNDAATLSSILAGGHEIGISLPAASSSLDKAALLADISAENEWLAKLIKKKSHIWRFAGAANNTGANIGTELTDSGYVMWNSSVLIPPNASAAAMAKAATDAIWKYETVTICFKENQNTADALHLVLDFIKKNNTACDVRTVSPAFYDRAS